MEEVKSQASEIPDFDFDAHRRSATARYQAMRPLYEEFSLVIKNIINEALKIPEITVHSIEYRAKSLDSFGKKAAVPSDLDPNPCQQSRLGQSTRPVDTF